MYKTNIYHYFSFFYERKDTMHMKQKFLQVVEDIHFIILRRAIIYTYSS